MKKIALPFVFLFFSFLSFAQIAPKKPVPSEYSWRILQEAGALYDQNDLSAALNLALKAKENRKEESEWESYVLENALSPFEVRRAGDEFEQVLPVLREREQKEALGIINKYLDLYSSERFHNSISELRDYIKAKSVYPEADFLIGKIYQIEGEYKAAYDFYDEARRNADFLDIPDQVFDILYSMADLARLTKNDEEYEQSLLLVLAKDPSFNDNVLKNAMLKIIDANKKENVERFFSLFRAESPLTMRALYELSKIYEQSGELKSSLFCSALGSVEGFTHIFNALYEYDQDYVFTNLSDFFAKVSYYPDICQWCLDSNFYDFMIDFGEKAGNRGDLLFANELLRVLSVNIPNQYYQKAAERKIVK